MVSRLIASGGGSVLTQRCGRAAGARLLNAVPDAGGDVRTSQALDHGPCLAPSLTAPNEARGILERCELDARSSVGSTGQPLFERVSRLFVTPAAREAIAQVC